MVTNPNDPRPIWLKTLLEVLRLLVTIAAAVLAALTATGCQWTGRVNDSVMSSRVDVLTTITPSIIPVETDRWTRPATPTAARSFDPTLTPAAGVPSQAAPKDAATSAQATAAPHGPEATNPSN